MSDQVRIWDKYLTERDRQVAEVSGYGGRVKLGDKPALVIIDVTVGFCGDRPQPILESIKKWRNSSGEDAWAAIPIIKEFASLARSLSIPVIYSRGTLRTSDFVYSGRWSEKNTRRAEDTDPDNVRVYDIVEPIAPQAGDIVIQKTKPSVFFGTPLVSYLVDMGIDSLICCGTSTSGCVRASVVDAFSNNYRVTVLEDATFDRTQSAHAMNLFDIQQKYGEVRAAADVATELKDKYQ